MRLEQPALPRSPERTAQRRRLSCRNRAHHRDGFDIAMAQEVGPIWSNINRDLINKSGERTAGRTDQQLLDRQRWWRARVQQRHGIHPGRVGDPLRGLGPEATLVLIDGRRVAPYPGNGGTSSFFDLRLIPEAAIKSIEILKDALDHLRRGCRCGRGEHQARH